MAPRKYLAKNIPIGEHVRIAVDLRLREFLNAHDLSELEFPNSLTAIERAYVHELVKKHGLHSKSRGKGDERFLTIYKRDRSTIVQVDGEFGLTKVSYQTIQNLLNAFCLSQKEKSDVAVITERINTPDIKANSNKDSRTNTGRLIHGIPLVPMITKNQKLESFRKTLPVTGYQNDILNLLRDNQVVLISGETGSGKTTQIPQFIMDEASVLKKPCRIICTQPRRLSAIAVSERVAYERNVTIGQDVGYQIRLESRVSPHTSLIYCTTGVLLRTLMSANNCISNITHVIVDEIHERDKFSDYLLIVLRDCLPAHPNLKLILMSATIDTDIFTNYFKRCPTIKIPGRLFPVTSYFLEDILRLTKYTNKEMKKHARMLKGKRGRKEAEEDWTRSFRNMSLSNKPKNKTDLDNSSDKPEMDSELKELMDSCLKEFWMHGTADPFAQILHLILTEDVSVDYQHSDIGCTILMLTAGRGLSNHMEQILNLGANIRLRSCNGWTAYDWAVKTDHGYCADLILAYTGCTIEEVTAKDTPDSCSTSLQQSSSESDSENRDLLQAYSHSFNSDEGVDHDLILHLISHLHSSRQNDGGILVFLPGYEDIVNIRDMILKDDSIRTKPYQLFILHSNMHTIDHRQVFKRLQGARKIILSTNIAQTSITIDDVVYVIDSGKVKEVTFDGVSGTTCLRANWISRACAKQRAGRAGRVSPGECYRLFSKARYEEMMLKFTTPDILRTPLQELCLQTKLLAPSNMPIAEFLDRAVEAPPATVTRQAVQLLKTMGALGEFEELTELGSHLVDLPVEPKLAKMLIYGVVLKCLDPVLTIVCCLAHKDPFVIPTHPADKRAVSSCRKNFSAGTHSDHMVLLRVFQAWQHSRQTNCERKFCAENFLNAATMEQIVSTRLQMLGQLRASGFVKARGPGDVKDLNTYSDSWAVIKAAITASLYPALCRIDKEYMTIRTQNETKVQFHPSSALRMSSNPYKQTPMAALQESLKQAPSDWMVYEEKSRVGPWCFIRTVTMITAITVALFGGPIRDPPNMLTKSEDSLSDSDSESEESGNATNSTTNDVNNRNNKVAIKKPSKDYLLSVDNWAVFKLNPEIAQMVYDLRRKFNAMFLRRMANPVKALSQTDDAVLKAVVTVLIEEDIKAGFNQPPGIGQRPRALPTEETAPNVYQSFARRDKSKPEQSHFVGTNDKSDSSSQISNCGQQNENPSKNGQQGFVQACQNNERQMQRKVSVYRCTKYLVFKLANAKTSRPNELHVGAEFSVYFRKIIKSGGQVYIIFLSKNEPTFEGVAKVVELPYENCSGLSVGRVVFLHWLSRLSIPTATCGICANLDISTMNDGCELDQNFGKAIMDFLINCTPTVGQISNQFYMNNREFCN